MPKQKTINQRIAECNTATDAIAMLKNGRLYALPGLTTIKNQYNPAMHDVADQAKRPDKRVVVDYVDEITGEVDPTKSQVKYEKVNRVTTSMQKLIVNRAVSFMFGNDTVLTADLDTDTENEAEQEAIAKQRNAVLKAVKRVMVDISERSHNRSMARELFTSTETAEVWYVTEGELHNKYGKPTRYRIRCAQFKPSEGDTLYPYFDAEKDLVAFSREFIYKDENQVEHNCFETYTSDTHYVWTNEAGNGWEVMPGYPEKIGIGKIPVVYVRQAQTEWHDVQTKIDRLEVLLSNFADTNDYHAAPKIFTTGDIRGWAKKGETGQIIEGETGATAQYLSWSQAPTAVQTEIETLLNLIYTETQTPDISFETLKSITAPSGVALKLMFADAHLKVQDKMEIFGPALRRRISIVKDLLASIGVISDNDALSTIIDAEVVPFTIMDEASEIGTYSAACGNKPVMSRRTAVQRLGYVDDVDAEVAQIEAEEGANAILDETF